MKKYNKHFSPSHSSPPTATKPSTTSDPSTTTQPTQSPNNQIAEYDYRRRIQSSDYYLSHSYRLVADYLMRNYITAAMSTAAEVAAAVNVDTTTVVRCAQALGYSGWPELQAQLKAHALAEFATIQGAGIQNYIDALTAWQRYIRMRTQSEMHPAATSLAVDAACAYADAVKLTDHCLAQPPTNNH